MLLLAILLPGVSMILNGRIISGIIAMILQVVAFFTFLIFGLGFFLWLILVIWAIIVRNSSKNEAKLKSLERKLENKINNMNAGAPSERKENPEQSVYKNDSSSSQTKQAMGFLANKKNGTKGILFWIIIGITAIYGLSGIVYVVVRFVTEDDSFVKIASSEMGPPLIATFFLTLVFTISLIGVVKNSTEGLIVMWIVSVSQTLLLYLAEERVPSALTLLMPIIFPTVITLLLNPLLANFQFSTKYLAKRASRLK